MPNERKQKVSSKACSESGGVSRTKPPADDADLPNIMSPSAKKAAKAAKNAAAMIVIEDSETETASCESTSSPRKSPIQRTQGK